MTGVTQAQIDELKQWLAHGTTLINALQPCAIEPPQPPLTGELWTHYQSAFLGTRNNHTIVVDTHGAPQPPPQTGSFPNHLITPTLGTVTWGDTIEYHEVLTHSGEAWGTVRNYGSVADPNVYYPEEIINCDWINLDTNVNRSMTWFTTGPVGGIMCPLHLPATGRYRLRQWGYVWDKAQANGGQRVKKFFWQADYLFGTTTTNLAWTMGQQTRPSIEYGEAWWDEYDGWNEYGYATTDPWQNGVPVVPNVNYRGWGAFGKDAGTMWRHDYDTYKASLSSFTS